MPDKVSEELQRALKSIADEFDLDERPVRERQIRQWKKLWFYWCGFTRIWWDDVAHDWRVYDDANYDTNGMGYYDKPINIFRAYLESIIAALSSTVPAIKCIPDDANSTADVLTAKGGTKIAELIYKHNDAPLLWAKALWIYCTQGMIAARSYSHSHPSFGLLDVEQYEDQEEELEARVCPLCGMDLDLSSSLNEADEYDPSSDDVALHYLLLEGKTICPQCSEAVDPELQKQKVVIPRLVGITSQAKARQAIEVYGGLFVRVPNWARSQDECPYLAYEYETHYTNVYKDFPDLRDNFNTTDGVIDDFGNAAYERWGRLSPEYYGEYPKHTPTVRHWWLRNSAFEACKDETLRKELKKKYPDGVHVVWVNDQFAHAENENLDDHWTLTYNPLSQYVHFDPLGLLVTSVQEITQDLTSLTLQTIEHGIPQIFADPTVLNFENYSKTETMPGGIYPARNKAGKSLSEGFHMVSTATLSAEVMPFGNQVQSLGQFASGALPSLWGGQSARGSETAAEYSMSRNQSLQRLQITWKMVNYWWKGVFSKVIPAYIKDMMDDERLVKEQYGRFVNILIKKSELDGKIGSIEVESSDRLPSTWGQVKDTVMQLLEMKDPMINSMFQTPENLGVLQDAIGLEGFEVPGSADREKQYEEIEILMMSAPIQQPPDPQLMMMIQQNPQMMQDPMIQQQLQPQEMPSIMPEFEVDNHQVEGDICRGWLVSEFGRTAKVENPEGYKNVMLHLKMHIQMLQQLQAPPPPQAQGENPAKNKLRPLSENTDAKQPAGVPVNQ
jgi:hypothetical protein